MSSESENNTESGSNPSFHGGVDESGLESSAHEGSSPRFGSGLADKLKNFEPALAAEWAVGAFQGQKNLAFFGKLATLLLCTYFLADLTAISLGKYLPEPPVSRNRSMGAFHRSHSLDEYNVVFTRNLFNSNGVIPGEEVGNPQDLGGPPVKTSLPFNLIGTMILSDELRSIATIEDKSASIVYPVRVQDEIPSKARIIKIEPRRVIFVNTASGRREFVDLPDNGDTGAPRITLGSKTGGGAGIEQVAPTQFSISRGEIDKAMGNLNNILTQARAVPHFENGAPAGYKLFQIVPGSIYQKLGLKDGDVIAGFDGQPANDPSVAFQTLSDLKNRNHLELQVKRDGRSMNFSYDFK
jgi:general secretion pathway protein C